jgi:hypothetical protein
MVQLTVIFEDHGVTFECAPAVLRLNAVYRAAVEALLRPQIFRSFAGAIDEKKSRDLLAQVYVQSVIVSSEPPMTERERYDWLLDHPFEFDELRAYAEHEPSFTGGSDGFDPRIRGEDAEVGGSDRPGGLGVSGGDIPIDRAGGDRPDPGRYWARPRQLAVVGGRSNHDPDESASATGKPIDS